MTKTIINNDQSEYRHCKKSAQYYSRANYTYHRKALAIILNNSLQKI